MSLPPVLAEKLSVAMTAAAKDHPRAARRLPVLDRDALAQVKEFAIEAQPVCEWLPADQTAQQD